MDESLRRAALGKVTRRLIPFLFLLYVVNILDRINVNFARLKMLDDLHMEEQDYALGAGIFFVGYLVFQVPSNLILNRTGARRWVSCLLIGWGLLTCATMLTQGRGSFCLLRILLGFAEAGFFPGVILYLTYWVPARERARAVALFMAAAPIAIIVGNPLSGAILEWMNGVGGLQGWQWVFLLEGAPAVLLGLVTLGYLTDRPGQAGWLTPEERNWLTAEMGREEKERERRHGLTLPQVLADPRVWLLTVLYFTVAGGSAAVSFYFPKLLEGRFPRLDKFQLGLVTAVPGLCAILCMVLNGAHSDRTGERRWHVALPALLSAAGWALAAWLGSAAPGLLGLTPVPVGVLSVLALTLAQAGIMSMLPTFWSLPTAFLSGVAAAGGIALINSVGNLGGFAAPVIIGQLSAVTGGFTGGLLAMAAMMALGGLLALCVRHDPAADGKEP